MAKLTAVLDMNELKDWQGLLLFILVLRFLQIKMTGLD